MKKLILFIIIGGLLGITPLLLWDCEGTKDVTDFRQEIIDNDGVHYIGTSDITVAQLSELQTYLDGYGDIYKLDILNVYDNGMVNIDYSFLSVDTFDYLQSQPISGDIKVINTVIPSILLPLFGITAILLFVVQDPFKLNKS